jgi:hypothetical protein
VNYYRIKAQQMPWGDYGSILASGMSRHLGRSEDGLIQLERTGPFIPPISFPGDVIVTDAFRTELESSALTGFTFAPIIKARIVELNWESWDRRAEEPEMYPETGEPEDYILGRPHSPELAERMGALWELIPGMGATVDRLGPNSCQELVLKPFGQSDIFRAKGVGFTYVTQRAMEWLAERAGQWVRGVETRSE